MKRCVLIIAFAIPLVSSLITAASAIERDYTGRTTAAVAKCPVLADAAALAEMMKLGNMTEVITFEDHHFCSSISEGTMVHITQSEGSGHDQFFQVMRNNKDRRGRQLDAGALACRTFTLTSRPLALSVEPNGRLLGKGAGALARCRHQGSPLRGGDPGRARSGDRGQPFPRRRHPDDCGLHRVRDFPNGSRAVQ